LDQHLLDAVEQHRVENAGGLENLGRDIDHLIELQRSARNPSGNRLGV
jgi:hypothetical protein